MHTLALVSVLVLLSSAAATPGDSRRYFPLQAGHEWTYEDQSYSGTSSMSVTRARAGVFNVEGFPGAPELRVRWSGQTFQAWDKSNRRWEALFRLGAKSGTVYRVDLPQPFWSGVRVRVATRRATVRNPALRRSYSRVVRLVVQPPSGLSDAGVTDLWFAPGVGLVRWVEQSFGGPVVHVLVSGPRM